jgi:phospholipid/cholesterol/gamma-HCH transport system permease protein
MLDQIGTATLEAVRQSREVLAFIGDWALALVTALRSPRTVHWRDVPRIMERAGADAVPIVALINFLLGLILAFQAAVQLRQFGANIYVADLVGIAVVRELGPLMTAIIVAGRSGSAFAAEIGTMKVSEEIDALKTMRLSLQGFLVLPRLLALLVVVPLLTLLGDAVAIVGGLVVGITGLDLTPQAYLAETQHALSLWDVFSGVLKSIFFALYLALVACQRGLVTRGGAEGVGRSTTSSVVTILFGLVLLDALFTVLFHVFGL